MLILHHCRFYRIVRVQDYDRLNTQPHGHHFPVLVAQLFQQFWQISAAEDHLNLIIIVAVTGQFDSDRGCLKNLYLNPSEAWTPSSPIVMKILKNSRSKQSNSTARRRRKHVEVSKFSWRRLRERVCVHVCSGSNVQLCLDDSRSN